MLLVIGTIFYFDLQVLDPYKKNGEHLTALQLAVNIKESLNSEILFELRTKMQSEIY